MNRALTTLQFWSLSSIVLLAFILVLVNISLFFLNRSAQVEINTRQLYISDSIKINRLSNQLIQSLANSSAQTNDEKIKALLDAHGIQFTASSPAIAAKESE